MTQTDFIVLLPLLILAGWLLLLLLLEAFLPAERKALIGWLSLLGFAGAALAVERGVFAIAWPAGGRWEAFGGLIVADGFAGFLTLLSLLSGAVATLLALSYLPRAGLARGEFYILLMLSVSGMVLMSQAADLLIVFLALELLSIPLYILAGLARPRLASEEAAMKYFLLGAFASGFFIYGVALIYGATGSTSLAEILAAERSLLMILGAALLLVGLAFKIAAVPFHMWTPDVYDGAPSVVTAFMAVGAKVGGFAALLRLFVTAFPAITPQWAGALALLAALTMILGNFAAIAQSNIKRMLAYSSMAHAGYILMALPAAGNAQLSSAAVGAALFYLLAYALTTLGAWAVVLAVEQREREGLALDDYAGLFNRQPALALGMAVFMVSLTGLPPTSGFIAKVTVFQAAIDAGYLWLTVIGVVTSLVSAYYYLRVVVLMFMRPGAGDVQRQPLITATVGAAAVATFLLGLLPGPLLQLAQQSVAAFIR